MNWKAKIIIAIGLGMSFYSCRSDSDFEDTPVLESRDLQVFRSGESADSIIWTLGFTDGDGDFGILEKTADSTTNNLIGRAYEIKNGVEVVLPNELVYKVPAIEDVNTSRGVSGEIELTIHLGSFVGRFDTIRIESYALDRAQNRSNTVSTPFFALN